MRTLRRSRSRPRDFVVANAIHQIPRAPEMGTGSDLGMLEDLDVCSSYEPE